jgi:hypothetical protein
MDEQVKAYRSRLISLAYEVLNHMETPPEGTSELEMLLLVSQAFLDVPTPEAAAPKEREGTFMFSRLDDVSTSFLRRLIERSDPFTVRASPLESGGLDLQPVPGTAARVEAAETLRDNSFERDAIEKANPRGQGGKGWPEIRPSRPSLAMRVCS